MDREGIDNMNYSNYKLPHHKLTTPPGKPLYTCSATDKHRLTYNQAVNANWMCTHCGNELTARKDKITELHKLATNLGYTAQPSPT
jgi:transcription initiation factor IIE alpha subunit